MRSPSSQPAESRPVPCVCLLLPLLLPALLGGLRPLAGETPPGDASGSQAAFQDGLRLLGQQQYSPAESAFQRATELAGGRCGECLLGLATVRQRQGDLVAAIAAVREAIAVFGEGPPAGRAYVFLGGLLMKQRPPDPEAAERAFDSAAQAGGSDRADGLSGMAAVRLYQHHYVEAVTAARASLRAEPQGRLARQARVALCRARAEGFLPGPSLGHRTFLTRPWQEKFAAAAAASDDAVPPLCPDRRREPRPAPHRPLCSEVGGDDPLGPADGVLILGQHPGVTKPKKLDAPPPSYSEKARQARVQGPVILEAIIDQEGCVTDPHILKGLPFGLDRNALDAVRGWVFEPATLYQIPVPVFYTLTVNFEVQLRPRLER